MPYVTNIGTDKFVHPQRLISAFVAHCIRSRVKWSNIHKWGLRGLGDLGRKDIYFHGAGEHW